MLGYAGTPSRSCKQVIKSHCVSHAVVSAGFFKRLSRTHARARVIKFPDYTELVGRALGRTASAMESDLGDGAVQPVDHLLPITGSTTVEFALIYNA